MLSLISFDVKGMYNGVFKDRLLQRLRARGIPEALVGWIDAVTGCMQSTSANNPKDHQYNLPMVASYTLLALYSHGPPFRNTLAITGAFRTVVTAVAEVEASIYPAWERHIQAAIRL